MSLERRNSKNVSNNKPKLEDKLRSLNKSILTLTNSGLPSLDVALTSEIKNLCKSDQTYLDAAYNSILQQLKKNHSQIRLSAFQLCAELFRRAHSFRQHVLRDLELILELTGCGSKQLPQPKDVSLKLQKLAICSVHQWKNQFGGSYKELVNCYNFLVRSKNIDFDAVIREDEASRAASAEQARVVNKVREEKAQTVKEAFLDLSPDIENAISVVENCMTLLLPSPEDFSLPEEDSNDDIFSSDHIATAEDDFDLRHFGLTTSYNLVVAVDTKKKVKVKRTSENSSVIDNLHDAMHLIKRRYLSKVKKWIDVWKDNSCDSEMLTLLQNLKSRLITTLLKTSELSVEGLNESSTDEDDDFEEVTKEGYESEISEDKPSSSKESSSSKLTYKTVEPYLDKPSSSKESSSNSKLTYKTIEPALDQPGSFEEFSSNSKLKGRTVESSLEKSSTSKKTASEYKLTPAVEDALNIESTTATITEPSCSAQRENSDESSASSRKKRLLEIAPKLPYDIDLYHWEDKDLKPPTLQSTKMDLPKFWSASEDLDEIPDPNGVAALRTRVIEFTGHFEPVKWSCRAPLPSGRLCPRKDRLKCPLHGTIVARDENGKCVDSKDEPTKSEAIEDSEIEEPVPDWQDPTLLAELKATTGLDLKMPDKGKRKRKTKVKPARKKRKGQLSSEVREEIEKRNFPGLTSIKKKNENAKLKLKKKIFNRSTLKRIAARMNTLDHRRHRDKFGDQFNYAHHTS